MPALITTSHYATITWLGYVTSRESAEIETHAIDRMPLTFAGFDAEVHAGLTRPSCSRVVSQYSKGTDIRNTRQVSIVSYEEMQAVAAALGLDTLDPLWLGASVVVEGIPDFSHIPPSSRLQTESGTTLTVDMQNRPCQYPAKTIEASRPGHGKAFKEHAKGRRGVTAWVERDGVISIGDRFRLHVPDQRAWRPDG